MQSKILSRGPDIDTEQCVRNIGDGRYSLILAATTRARELAKQQKEKSTNVRYLSPVVTALLEVQNKQIGIEYLAKVDTKSQKIGL
jgi:DNA-directed RNA polymerase subunit K/omega